MAPRKPSENSGHADPLLDLGAKIDSLPDSELDRLIDIGESARLIKDRRNSTGSLLASGYRAPALIPSRSSELVQLADNLGFEEGYRAAIDTQRAFGLLRPSQRYPDFGKVLDSMLPRMLRFASTFQSPMPILATKGRSFYDLVAAMDMHMSAPEEAYLDDSFRDCYAVRRSRHWGVYFIEAPAKVQAQEFDDPTLKRADRLEAFNWYKASHEASRRRFKIMETLFGRRGNAEGVGGMDRWKWAHLMMLSRLKEGQPIDAHGHTMLDEDPALSASEVPIACWDSRQVAFCLRYSDCTGEGSWFRRSVGVGRINP